MDVDGYIDYERREFCKDIGCPVQLVLDDSDDPDKVRRICKEGCIHSTYEFHHWLIQKGYLLVRPQ